MQSPPLRQNHFLTLMPSKPGETRVEHVQCEMEPERAILSVNDDHQSPSAMVSLCPVPVSESTTGPGAGLLSFGTVVEPAVLAGDHRY